MSFKNTLKLGLVFLTALAMSGCQDDIQLTRTAQDGFTITRQIDVPVYKRQCHFESHFGAYPQCGSYQQCHTQMVCHNGHCKPYTSCTTYYNSCYATFKVCNDIYSHSSKTTFELEFDPRATLNAGDVEKITANMRGNQTVQTFTLNIKSKRYKYSYPISMKVDLSKPNTTVKAYAKILP